MAQREANDVVLGDKRSSFPIEECGLKVQGQQAVAAWASEENRRPDTQEDHFTIVYKWQM